MTNTLSLHSLRVEGNQILDEQGKPFDVVSYSKFKYGDGAISKQYGESLAQSFIDAHADMLKLGVQIAVTSASYRYVPKGATSIAYFFTEYLNTYLAKIGVASAELIKIGNNDNFTGDYASFTGEKREELMKKSIITLSGTVSSKKLVIIDDIRITGSGERRLLNFFADKGVSETFLLYVAVADSAYAATNPQIESIINQSWMDSLEKLSSIMHSKEYMINARVCKYVLSYPDQVKLADFLQKIDLPILEELYTNIINDNYSTSPEYQSTILLIKQILDERKAGTSSAHE